MSPEFTYSQRPFSRRISNEEYDQAVGRTHSVLLAILSQSPNHSGAQGTSDESAGRLGHECNGTYKTFAAEHCPYCQRKPYHPTGKCEDSTCGRCKY